MSAVTTHHINKREQCVVTLLLLKTPRPTRATQQSDAVTTLYINKRERCVVTALKENTRMLVQETIQPLLRFFNANITADTDTAVVSISNTQAVRIVAHTGSVVGTAELRVFVNTTNSTSGATELTDKEITPLASNSSYEIFVTGAEAYAALERASHLFVQVDVTGTASVPISIEVSALPGRDIPATLPTNWTRIL